MTALLQMSIFLAILFYSCSGERNAPETTGLDATSSQDDADQQEEDLQFEGNVEYYLDTIDRSNYPVFTKIGNDLCLETINAAVLSYINRFAGGDEGYYVDSCLIIEINSKKISFYIERNWNAHILGGNGYAIYPKVFNFDLENCRIIKLADFFKINNAYSKRKLLNEVNMVYNVENYGDYGLTTNPPLSLKELFELEFSFSNDYLFFYLGSNEMHKSQATEIIKIPLSEIKEM
jgi:hypothetical protein